LKEGEIFYKRLMPDVQAADEDDLRFRFLMQIGAG
jgi:hypothetical protein